jgi:hypothetical protein
MARYVAGNAGAVFVGLTIAYIALVTSGTVNPRLIDLRTIDLMEYLSVSHLILQGHGGGMYDFHHLAVIQSQLAGQPAANFGVLAFLYPPFLAFALIPLALLPYGWAYVLWLASNLVLLSAALYHLERYARLQGRAATAFRWLSLLFLPVFFVLALGQVSVLLLALVVAAFIALQRGHDELAGVALALACMKPAYIAPLLLVVLLRRRWRACIAFVVSGLVLLVLPVPVLGPRIYLSYESMLRQVTAWQGRSIDGHLWYQHVAIPTGTYAPEWNHSFAGFAELLLSGRGATFLYMALCLIALALLVWCTLRCERLDIPFGLAVVVGLLVSPHTLIYDDTLLLLPVAIALRYRARAPYLLPITLVLGWVAVAVGYRAVFAIPIQITVLAAAMLAGWLAVEMRATPEDARPQLQTEADARVPLSPGTA